MILDVAAAGWVALRSARALGEAEVSALTAYDAGVPSWPFLFASALASRRTAMVQLNHLLTHSLLFTAPLRDVPASKLPSRSPLAQTLRMVANAPSPSPPPSPSMSLPPLPSPFELLQRLTSKEAQALQKELFELALEQDAQVVFRRSLDLARAVRTVSSEAVASAVANNASTPLLLRRLCEELGATYVKLGQFIASSPTLFPPEYVAEFQKTLDQTPAMPWGVVKPLIEEELGRPLEEVYASVEQTPLAAASIAQVHAAKLKTGEDVVIKVQKRGVQGSLRADLDLLYANARVLQLLGVVTSELSDVVGTLREAILEEIDFKLEATRTEQFATFLSGSPELAGLVTVPRVYRQASATRVLTLERLYGVALADLESVRKYAPQPELALIVALNTWVSSVLTNEWFHADVHAGNLLVLTDGRVAFIDFGIVGSIPRKTANAMLDFVRATPKELGPWTCPHLDLH